MAWRIRTGANGGSEWAEAGSLEGSGGARSQASGEPGHEERNREREREREKRRRRGVKGELAEGTGG